MQINVGSGGTRQLIVVGMNYNCVLSSTFLNAELREVHFETRKVESIAINR